MTSTASKMARQLSRHAEAICRHYLSKGRKQGRYWIVGNVQNAPGHSLFVRLTGPSHGPGAAGKWTDAATGDHGDLLDLIAAQLGLTSLGDTLDEARRFLNQPHPAPAWTTPGRTAPTRTGSIAAARRLWAGGQPIAGTLADRYLAGRHLSDLGPLPALRFHSHCYYRRDGRPKTARPEAWPALLAQITDIEGHITGLHRTWLDPATAGKAPLDNPRKAMGAWRGHGVHFGRVVDRVVAGEGLETVLSLRKALPHLPAVAALSAPHLAALILPAGLKRLYIAVDADKAGIAAAGHLAAQAERDGIETIRLWPHKPDFNDDLQAHGVARLRRHLRPQLAPDDIRQGLTSSSL
ncbi:toprim domain-containing protein [Maricaulis sp.]|uniref:DUF7146 domain-containing protein n=1 Tax=Maricaulis sp. TaxID=1486257 RepID=UPI003296F7BE